MIFSKFFEKLRDEWEKKREQEKVYSLEKCAFFTFLLILILLFSKSCCAMEGGEGPEDGEIYEGRICENSRGNSWYMGGELQACRMCFKKNYGEEIFKRINIGGNIFIGIPILTNLGIVYDTGIAPFSIEVGYQYLGASKTSLISSGDRSLGSMPLPSFLGFSVFKSSFVLKGPHINLMVSSPIFWEYFLPDGHSIQFFGGVGFGHIKGSFERQTFQIGPFFGVTRRKMSISKDIFRGTLGIHYNLTDYFSFRGTFLFLNTKKLHAYSNDGIPVIARTEPKNNICYGFGVRWLFY